MRKTNRLIYLLYFIFAGCTHVLPGPTPALPDFTAFASARSFDAPGTIYRMDETGDIWQVTSLGLEPLSGEEVLPRVVDTAEFSLKEVLETIGVPASQVPANATADFEQKHRFFTESVDGIREYLTDEQIDKKIKVAFQNISIRESNRYFLIRETVKTKNINFTSSTSWVSNLGIEAKLKELVKGKAALKWVGGKEFSLQKKFDAPLRYWYKAEVLRVTKAAGMGPGQPAEVIRNPNNTGNTQIRIPSVIQHKP